MMNKKEIKIFVRLLKELGIYHSWLKNRINYLKDDNQHVSIKEVFDLPAIFSDAITHSFIWSETNEEHMWNELYFHYNSSNTISYVLNHDNCLKELKTIIKRHT